MSEKYTKFTVNLKGYSVEEREAIALKIIDKIIQRTKSGKDKDNKTFPKYATGPDKGKTPNLTLTGDMLDLLSVVRNASAKVQIGYSSETTDDETLGKVEGNVRGTYGQPTPIKGGKYARNFLGITESDLQKILKEFPKGSDESQSRAEKTILLRKNAEKLSGSVELEDLDE